MSAGGVNVGRGRPVYTRGPVIVGLEVLSAITSLCAIVALIVSLGAQSSRIADIQASRVHAAATSCELVRGLVLSSGSTPAQHARARAYIARTPLRDCHAYAVHVTRTP